MILLSLKELDAITDSNNNDFSNSKFGTLQQKDRIN